jgi:polyphosphate kinase
MKYKYEYFINRELSWLEFNDRVLSEAEYQGNPLLEKCKFISITSSNLDEFFMIRIAALKAQIDSKFTQKDISGMTPIQQMVKIEDKIEKLIKKQYTIYRNAVIPELEKNGIMFLKYKDLTENEKKAVEEYFEETLFPILTPTAIDNSRPFPLLQNKSLNIIVELKKDKDRYSFVQVPSIVERMFRLPGRDKYRFILIEEIIKEFIGTLFEGYSIKKASEFRITRDSDVIINEDAAEDLLSKIEKSIKNRKWGSPVRLEICENIEKETREYLKDILKLKKSDVYRIDGPIDLTFLMKLWGIAGKDNLRFLPEPPVLLKEFSENRSVFDVMKEKEIIYHLPYESFEPVIDLVEEAARDPKVLAIKQTLYRVSGHSPIVKALKDAANNGKQVTVLVELKARFDEEQNINWAKELEKAGCHVIYGLKGLKTHAKLLLVVRQETEGIQRYVHLSTGNYNDNTAKLYSDIGFFSTDEDLCTDISYLFNTLTGFSMSRYWNKISVAPNDLRAKLYELIDNEMENQKAGKKTKIIMKANSLTDKAMIEKLYDASRAGVEIKLIIRGACSLKAGIKNISENIEVFSIVGRHLEHSRIYYFENDGDRKIYLSSADLMSRNLDRRIEIMFPVEDEDLKKEVEKILDLNLTDNVKKRILEPDGSYKNSNARSSKKIIAQTEFYKYAKKRNNES